MANQLIDLSQSGSLGANSENAFASLGYGVELSAEFCNGFDLQFKAQASGNAGLSANITEFFEAIVEIEAGVEVGIRIAAQLSPNLRDEIGLIASFQAYLKAYIRARLELQLTLEKIIQNVSGNSSAVQLRIFKKFLEQIEIGVGVEANAQIALTAAAEIVCRGRIFEDENTKAGFDFRLNAEAAFMFGAGFDFFSMLRFENITEFFRDSKNILLEEIEEHIDDRQLLEKHQKEFFFMIWNTVLDTVIDASTSKIENKSKYFYETISNFSYNFLFDQINNIYREFIKDQTRELMDWLELNEDTYNEDINKILIWLETIEKEWDNKTSIFDLLPHLTLLFQAIERLGYDKTPSLSNIISHLYFIGYLIDNSNRTNWKNIPEFVQQNFEDVTGRRILEISSETDCFEYLEKSCIEDFLKMETTLIENRMRFFVDQLSSQGISVSEFIKLTISLRDEDSKKKLLGIGIDLVDHLLSEEILEFLENDLKSELQQNGNYGDEIIQVIIENLYQSYKTIFIGMFKKVFVEGGTKADYENLSMLAGKFLINIISKNFSFLVNELLNYSARNITTSIAQCESKIRGGSLDQMVNKLQNKAVDRLELVIPYELPDDLSISVVDKMLEATNDFLLDILRIARTSMGTETWTEARIDQISGGLEYVIFNPDSNHLNFQTLTEDQIKIKIDELTKCDFLPDFSKNELLELIETLQTIGLKQLKAFLFEMPLALAEYLLKLLKILFVDFIIEILDALWEKLKELLAKLKELIEDLKEKIQELIEKIEEVLEDIVEAIGELFNKTLEAIDEFFDSLMGKLDLLDTSWLEDLLDTIWGFLGGDSDEDKAKKVLNKLREKAKENLRNSNFKQALEQAAKENNFNGNFFRNYMDSYIIDSSIRNDLNKIKFQSTNAINESWGSASRRFHNTISSLERDSLNYWSSNQIRKLRSDELRINELRYINLERQIRYLNELNPREVKINCPLAINIAENDTPIYGKYLYLDIDFGSLDIKSVIQNQLSLDPQKLLDPDGNLSLYEWERELRYISNPENFCPLQVKVLLNGREIDLSTCEIQHNRIQGHIATSHLKHGINELFLLITTPSEFAHKRVERHIRFYCDHTNQRRASNSVFIDPIESVIDSQGDDHIDALKTTTEDRELIVIKNNSPDEVKLDNWVLSDAAGHKFVFGSHQWLKPGRKYEIVVGKETLSKLNWKEYYKGRLIAVLNNRGEFLKLENTNGKVISHMYTGSPRSNKHIKFISFR